MATTGSPALHDDRLQAQLLSLQGKYLAFSLGGEVYGFNIVKVSEIIGVVPITHVPRVPAFVQGVINLRGKIIPVIDLRLKFGLEPKEYDRETCIIVSDVRRDDHQISVGMIVDTVLSVHDFDLQSIAPVPEYGASINTNFIQAVGKTPAEGQVVILLDVDLVIGEGRFGIERVHEV